MDCEPVFLSRPEVDELHAESLKLFGGIAGVRDDSLVESAMGAAMNEWFYGQGDLFSVAAAYAFDLAQTRPFWMVTSARRRHRPSRFLQ